MGSIIRADGNLSALQHAFANCSCLKRLVRHPHTRTIAVANCLRLCQQVLKPGETVTGGLKRLGAAAGSGQRRPGKRGGSAPPGKGCAAVSACVCQRSKDTLRSMPAFICSSRPPHTRTSKVLLGRMRLCAHS